MSKYVLKTSLINHPNRCLFYNGTDKDKNVPFSLNTLIAYRDVDAKQFNKDEAYALLEKLNSESHLLQKIGLTSFDVIEIK